VYRHWEHGYGHLLEHGYSHLIEHGYSRLRDASQKRVEGWRLNLILFLGKLEKYLTKSGRSLAPWATAALTNARCSLHCKLMFVQLRPAQLES
jgi:hypothetical protein